MSEEKSLQVKTTELLMKDHHLQNIPLGGLLSKEEFCSRGGF